MTRIASTCALDPASTAIITGTTSGLGRALLQELHGKVKRLHCVNRRADPELEARFPEARFHVFDIAAWPEAKRALAAMLAEAEGPRFVFLNAAVNPIDNDTHFRFEPFHEALRTNVEGYAAFISALEEQAGTRATVVCIGSTAIFVPNRKNLGYFLSKLANDRLVRSLQRSRTRHEYKLVVLGPILSRMARDGNLSGAKKAIFEALALEPEEAAARILRFAVGGRRVARITLGAYLFYRAAGLIFETGHRLKELSWTSR